ncbi:uncharacterized protein EI97DRAFT_431503 [Westerdykella ornata]|uniref:Endonuclease/exonuclease/phosphatase domain-containing protein n=1 Tax=Westerdykella ornata TaxID=318751 RepID=A0A6A6JQR0_WESOR|nr:uncharacterized protein EI97DRAFT_431503 [Westerdykella ornata]KAF2278238.1 hypothetical protein EI97DRAFT_431503 [Westerdykella ornata]
MASRSLIASLFEKQFRYVLKPQPFYSFTNEQWRPQTETSPAVQQGPPLESIRVLTWNIDFMASHPRERMSVAIQYLGGLIASLPASTAVAVLLQEMVETEPRGPQLERPDDAKDISMLLDADWVRKRFYISDTDMSTARAHYGQVTLLDKRLSVAQVSRLPFVSEYGREAVIVDVRLSSASSCILRICNVHLDSLNGPLRPVQWAGLGKQLQDEEQGVVASIVAGDCNATRPRDRAAPEQNGFKDAYLELGGVEGDEAGATWGFQSRHWQRFGRSRLDKIVFCGKLQVKTLDRIGVGVKVEDEQAVREMAEEALPFVTDHYGLMAEFTVEDSLMTIMTEGA